MTTALTTTNALEPVKALVLDSLNSPNSRAAYSRALDDFFTWRAEQDNPPVTRALVQHYRTYLQTRGRRDNKPGTLSAAMINRDLSAIRKLVSEAAYNGLIEPVHANGIARVEGIKAQGVRAGNWLTRAQAQRLLNAPDITTLKGLRDRAILAVMLGAGLRRSEVATLTVEHVQQRDGRWVIVDLTGKGNRTRSVPIPSWVKTALDAWTTAAGITGGLVYRSINRGDKLSGASLTAQAVHDVVAQYSAAAGCPVAAHDLRRTYAKLAHKNGAGLDQIQLSLGHASIETTERYLNVEQDFTDAPGDRLGLKLDLD